jgi:hypothetical protein
MKLFRLPDEADGNFAAASNTIVRAQVYDDDLKGNSTPGPTQQEIESEGQDIDWTELETPWNEYIVAGQPRQLVQTKCIVTGIQYYPDRFTNTGDPLFQVDSQVVVGKPRDAEGFVSP